MSVAARIMRPGGWGLAPMPNHIPTHITTITRNTPRPLHVLGWSPSGTALTPRVLPSIVWHLPPLVLTDRPNLSTADKLAGRSPLEPMEEGAQSVGELYESSQERGGQRPRVSAGGGRPLGLSLL